jgi:hypothetical protein
LERSLEVIEDKLRKDAETMVMFEQDQLRSVFNRPESLYVPVSFRVLTTYQALGMTKGRVDLTRRFLSAMKTLGVETTPMVELDDAPSRS